MIQPIIFRNNNEMENITNVSIFMTNILFCKHIVNPVIPLGWFPFIIIQNMYAFLWRIYYASWHGCLCKSPIFSALPNICMKLPFSFQPLSEFIIGRSLFKIYRPFLSSLTTMKYEIQFPLKFPDASLWLKKKLNT